MQLFQCEYTWDNETSGALERVEFVVMAANLEQAEIKCKELRPDIPDDIEPNVLWLNSGIVQISE